MFDRINTCKKYREVRKLITSANTSEVIQLPKPILPNESLGKTLSVRRSIRQFEQTEFSLQELSNLLWCANGVNTNPEDEKVLRTAPTANNHQEIDLYIFDLNGCYKYDAIHQSLIAMFKGDVRQYIGKQPFVETAPIVIAIVADYARMVRHNIWKKKRYSCVDAGYVSQNIYLYCAAKKLSTVACGKINHQLIKKLIGLNKGDVILCHPIGKL